MEIHDGQLLVDGKVTCLWGGELQYFRVRDRDLDSVTTVREWSNSLDSMRGMGMNLVSTYVPWDYHEQREGAFDFSGARDLGLFLQLCHEKGFFVHLKPGPYITAEWPTGWNSFGALPDWLPDRISDAMVKTSAGHAFSYDPMFPGRGKKCSLLHPSFLDHVERWFSAVAPFVKRFTNEQPCVVLLQLDNETNMFWQSRYAVDYSESALARYAFFLREKYGEVKRLNQAYGGSYSSFSEVEPPRKPPSGRGHPGPQNMWRRDWFEAGHEMIAEYLARLRRIWESLGLQEGPFLFTTNDTLHYPPLPSSRNDILFARPSVKKRSGLFTLDCYPRHHPFHWTLFDGPFQSELALRAMDLPERGEKQRYRYAAEIQGGMFPLPLLRIRVRAEQTDQMLCKMFGHGLRGGSVFVIRDGYNRDNSIYAYQSALDLKGRSTARYHVLRKYGRMLESPGGRALLLSEAVDSPVAILVDSREGGRMEGALLDERSLWGSRYAGWLGLLLQSGYSPKLIDVSTPFANDGKLSAAIFITSGLLREEVAENLLAMVNQGVHLVFCPCWPRNAIAGRQGPHTRALLESVLPLHSHGTWRHEMLEYRIAGVHGTLRPQDPVRVYEASSHGETFLWPGDREGLVSGLRFQAFQGDIFLVGSDVAEEYGSGQFEHMAMAERWQRRRFVRALMGVCGVQPLLDWQDMNVTAWCRRGETGEAFLFATNGGRETCCAVRFLQTERSGLRSEGSYLVQNLLEKEEDKRFSGEALSREGVPLSMKKYGSTIVRIVLESR